MIFQGKTVTASVDDAHIYAGAIPSQQSTHGFVGLGTTNFGLADFKNFAVSAA